MVKKTKTENENQETKSRKINSGPVRSKERTIKKMIAAVGTVLQKYGYPGLTSVNISKEVKLDRKLIYTYFGNTDNLIETFIKEKDFWKSGLKIVSKIIRQDPKHLGITEIIKLLQLQFDNLLKDKIQQKILHWELAEKNKLLNELSDEREQIYEELFTFLDENFENSAIDIRALLAIQIGGIYYLSLYAKSNGNAFCGININEIEGKERISKSIQNTLEMAYDLFKTSQ